MNMDSGKPGLSKGLSESDKKDLDKGPVVKVDALGRKVWDRNYFAEKALSRSAGGDAIEEAISSLYTGTFQKPVIAVPEIREDLKPRKEALDFSKYVGRSETIDALGPKSKQGGFFCKTCNCLLKDSQTYLDHLNGKKHNRLLGMSMRVKKVDAQTVAAKLKRLSADSFSVKTKEELEKDARERIKELEMYEKEMREKRKLLKKEKKKKKTHPDPEDVKEEHNGVKREQLVKSEEEEEYLNPELEAMRASGLPISFG